MNRVTLLGNLGKDPESRTTQSGSRVVSFSVATSETWRDKQSGEKKTKTDWHNIVIWNEGLAKVAEQYLKKGSKVLVEGKLKTRKWQDQSGADRYKTEVVLENFSGYLQMLGDGGKGSDRAPPADDPEAYGQTAAKASGGAGPSRHAELDDEIPFGPQFL